MWINFQTNYGRTNNPVEGQNNKMKLYCGAAHLEIFTKLQTRKNLTTVLELMQKETNKVKKRVIETFCITHTENNLMVA